MKSIRLVPLPDIPEVQPGDSLVDLLTSAAASASIELRDGALVVCQKIVSKAEGCMVDLTTLEPSEQAIEIAREHEKDPRHMELVLRETRRIVRRAHGVLICETHHGLICANAGVDLSNAPGDDIAICLPPDSDKSAAELRSGLLAGTDGRLGIVISDTYGRPWREGLVDMAIGSAGIAPISDQRGRGDMRGRELQVTAMCTVDQLAAAAGMLMLKDSGVAAVWVEGFELDALDSDGSMRDVLRDPNTDLFR